MSEAERKVAVEKQIQEVEWGSGDGVPDGDYPAEFVRLEEAPEHKDFGPGFRWIFRILGGEYAGRQVGRIGPAKPTPKNASGAMLRGLTGKEGATGEKTAIKDLIGKRVKIVVLKGRVKFVFPLPK